MEKTVVLERVVNLSGQLGSFGFSIMGGATAKLPAVVCNVEVGGPAAQSEQVNLFAYICCMCTCPLCIACIGCHNKLYQ